MKIDDVMLIAEAYHDDAFSFRGELEHAIERYADAGNKMISVNDSLPHTGHHTISDAIIFMVDGKKYAGYYHMNGVFYSCEKRRHDAAREVTLARGPNQLPQPYEKNVTHVCTHWEYLREQEAIK
jgi:hypothetical protein